MGTGGAAAHGATRIAAWAAPGRWQRALERSPAFAEGLAQLGDSVDADGALPAWFKRLTVGVVAAAKGQPAECARWIGRARAAGADDAHVAAAGFALVLSRGTTAGAAVLDLVAEAGEPRSDASCDVALPDAADVLAYFASVFGAPPERITLLAEHDLAAMRAYHLMRQASLDGGALAAPLADLLLLTVNAAEYQPALAAVHAGLARSGGATETQLVEAGVCAVVLGGVAAWLAASEAIVSSRTNAPT